MNREHGKLWVVVRQPEGDESAHVGPFANRDEAEDWAVKQKEQGRTILGIHALGLPLNSA